MSFRVRFGLCPDGAHRSAVWSISVLFLLPLLLAASVTFNPVLVADINPSGSSFPDFPIAVGDSVYFYANNGQVKQLFVANEAGATQLTSLAGGVGCINRDYDSSPITADDAADAVVFFSVDANGDCTVDQVWRTDGTPGGTRLVQQFAGGVDSIFAAEDGFYAVAPDGSGTEGIWYSDGSEDNATLLRGGFNLNTGSFRELAVFDGGFYFAVDSIENRNFDLWRADPASAVLVAPTTMRRRVGGAVYQNTLYMADGYGEVWRLPAGSDTPVRWQDGSIFYGHVSNMQPIGDRLYLVDWDTSGQYKQTLWRYDGTADRLEEIATYTSIGSLAGLEDSIYFTADQYTEDGTRLGGSYFLRLPLTATKPTSVSPEFTIPGDKVAGGLKTDGDLLYMQVNASGVSELWVSDGSAAGTRRVTNTIADFSNWGSNACPCVTVAGGTVYFDRQEAATGVELWRLERVDVDQPLFLPHIIR